MAYAEKVFEFFEKLCSVPHGSGNIWQISNLCCEFAKERGLKFIQDKIGNVIIYKGGSSGYENSEPVIIQGHMDMVTVKSGDCDIDLESEGLRLKSDNEYLWAEGTSLGADDGIALAMAMAVLDSKDIPHPPIEAIFTVNEETCMDGAEFIDLSEIKGRRMINIDSEDEGIITVGCAGGIRVYGSFDLNAEDAELCYGKICIGGLTGGHSGSEIHKGRANAICLMGRLLHEINRTSEIRLISANGGEKDNAIANSCYADIAYAKADCEKIEAVCKKCNAVFQNECHTTDPNLIVSFENRGVGKVFAASKVATDNIIFTLFHAPNGVQVMSSDIEGLVQTSLNFGVLETSGESIKMTFCLRSSVGTQKLMLTDVLTSLIEKCGGTATTGGDYPAWEYAESSALRDTAVKEFEAQYGRKPKISVIHAGLECGLFSDKLKGLDCISIGPDILDIHTVNEKLDIASTQRTWELLLNVLKALK